MSARQVATLPDPEKHPWKYRYVTLKWRAGLAVSTHPVLLALIIALAVVTVPVVQLLNVSATLRSAQGRLDVQQEQITGLVAQIQHDRAKATFIFCKRLNANQRQAARLTYYLRALILSGAKSSHAFEDLYRTHHFPGYQERLRKAERQAQKIVSFSPKPLNCEQARARIVRDTPPPPSPAKPPPDAPPPLHGNP